MRSSKAVAESVPMATASIQPLATGVFSGGTGLDVSGGLIGYIAGFWARQHLRKVEKPLADDMKVMKLDKEAINLLEKRLTELEGFAGLIQMWRSSLEVETPSNKPLSMGSLLKAFGE